MGWGRRWLGQPPLEVSGMGEEVARAATTGGEWDGGGGG